MKRIITLSMAVVSSATFSQVLGGMDHINVVGPDLVSTAANGRIEVSTDLPETSRMVIDDFYADQNILKTVEMAFENTSTLDIDRPNGWRISIWSSATDAAASGNDLTGNVVQTTYVDFATGSWTTTPLFGTGATNFASKITFSNLNLDIGTGVRYIGVAPVQASTNQIKWRILAHKNPFLLGNNTANDSLGINPGGGLGLGTLYSVGTNAAYSVELVPEPLSFLALGLALVALTKKRRAH